MQLHLPFSISLSLLLSLSLWAFFFLYLFTHKFYCFSQKRFSSPPSYPFVGSLFSFYKNRLRLLSWYTDLLSDSPTRTVVLHRLGSRRTIVTANPANVEYMLKTNFVNYPKGKPFTDILGDLLGCGIFNVDGDLWSIQRKLASHEFSAKSLREFVVKTLEDEVHLRLIPLLENAARTNDVIDLQDVLGRLAFDTVCKVTVGTEEQCLDMSRAVPEIVKAFDTATGISAKRAMAPLFVTWKIKRMLNVGSEKELKESVKMVHNWVSQIIRNKNHTQYTTATDLLSRLLSAGHSEEVVRDMVVSFIMAGRDTTSAAMTWLFWLLTKHPKVEQAIIKEVTSVLSDNSKSASWSYTFEELKDMNYLKACLCESMRLYPPVAWDSKHAAAADILPDGTRVGKGDKVTYFPYGMGRMEELWGKDRLEFKPERWFEKGDHHDQLIAVSPFKFPVFQAGPRMCLGKEMAFIQMKYVVATVLKRFEFRAVTENSPTFVPLLTAHMAGGLLVHVRERTRQKSTIW